MWFGTEGGLNRYDGHTVRVYESNSNDSTSLEVRWTRAICEDTAGTLWVGAKGLHRYNRDQDNFTRYSLGQDAGTIICLLYDSTNVLWIGTSSGLFRFDINTGKAERMPIFEGESGVEVFRIVDDHHGNLILAGVFRSTLLLFNKTSLEISVLVQGFGGSTSVYPDGNIYWIGTLDGLVRFDASKNSTVRFGSGMVEGIQKDHLGRLWVGTRGEGLNLLDQISSRFLSYAPAGVKGSWVHSLFVDRSGTLWVGTNNGVSKASRWSKPFRYYSHSPLDSHSVVPGEVRSVLEDSEGKIWIGAYGNQWSRFDPARNTFRTYTHLFEKGGVAFMMYQDKAGTMWIGGNGLRTIRPGTDAIERRRLSPTVEMARVEDIHEDRFGNFWVATWALGIGRYDRTKVTTRWYAVDTTLNVDGRPPSVFGIHEDHTGRLWVSTVAGGNRYQLYEYNRELDVFERRLRNISPRISSRVNCLYEDTAGRIWLGLGTGLGLYEVEADSVELVSSEGRSLYSVFGILEDRRGNLWMSTYRGLSKYDTQSKRFTDYPFPGLSLYPVQVGCCKPRTGEFIFGLGEGFVMFHPDSIRDNPDVPPIKITDFKLFDQSVGIGGHSPLKENILITDRLDLAYNQNTVTFEFAALDYTSPDDNQYAYTLEGFDESWVRAGTRHRAHYTNVPPGEYVFRVKGSNSDGVWNEAGASIVVVVTPPWWKTTGAYAGYALAVLGLLYTIRRSEKNRDALRHQMEIEKVKAEKLREVDQLKSRFFANISHEFRTPLTLIKGPLEKMLAEEREETKQQHLSMMQRSADRLLRLINQLLDLSKLESGAMKLRASRGNIVPFVKGIASSFESSAGMRGITVTTESDAEEIEAYFDRDKLEKILTNLLSNAFKFTPDGGRVTVRCHSERTEESAIQKRDSSVAALPQNDRYSRGFLSITIADTGIGISADELPRVFDRFYQVDQSQTWEYEGSGIGLALTKELVELHHGTISVRSEIGKGTEFTLTLPLGQEHLKDGEVLETEDGEREEVAMPIAAAIHVDDPAGRGKSPLRDKPTRIVTGMSLPIVLIIEDNADVRAYIKEYLVKSYHLIEAHDGAEGIERAQEVIPDLIISDVMMPKKDGYEVCKTLKLDERTSHVPIILLTARAGTENKIEGLETGADDYLTKPFDAKELLVRARNLIEVRRKLRERFSVGQVLKPGEIAVTSMDDAFLRKVKVAVESRMEDEDFSVEELAVTVAMSRSQLHRKLTALTNLTPSEFIRYLRLHRAMDLLKQNSGTVAEVAYSVGFGSVPYFTQAFKAQFGSLPSDVRKQAGP
jgi:signal transduction histidine kinase/ligand-binding sensor domain-containing protein/DNA-binding response OmpR family regulator